MAIYHREIQQGSEEWHRMRCGIPTASELHRIITPVKGELSKQHIPYLNRLLAEWALGDPIISDYESDYMALGKENEDAAVSAFEFQTGLETEKIGFITTDDGLIGASPDRLVPSQNGSLECKCPSAQIHIGYMWNPQSLIDEYNIQVQAQTWIGELDRRWLCSYHPKLTPVIVEVSAKTEFVKTLSGAVRFFVDAMLERRERLEREFGPFMRPEPKRAAEVEDWLGVSMEDVDVIIAARGEQ